MTSLVSAQAWINPTGYNDPGDRWTNEPYAYDDNLVTSAHMSTFGDPYPILWGPYLELTLASAIQCDKIRYYIYSKSGWIDTVDVDVYRDGSWVDVYEGSIPTVGDWIEQSFTEGIVTEARIRFGASNQNGGDLDLAEFDFREIPPLGPGIPEFGFSVTMITSLVAALYLVLRKRYTK